MKKRVRVPIERKDEMLKRLANGESLRSIARSFGVTYQALQYHRELWGCTPLKPSLLKGKDHPNWRGGVSIDRQGYRLLYHVGRQKAHPYSYEHILVAEKKIGRRLLRNEHVHHLNGNKLDNSPSNLLVCSASEHRKLHRTLEEFALQLVREGKIVFRKGSYAWA